MTYDLKLYRINKGLLVDDKTMSQVLRRLSKRGRAYLAEHKQIAIDVDGYCFVICKSQILLNIRRDACIPAEYALFRELAWRSKSAIKAYQSMWSLLHEVNALQ